MVTLELACRLSGRIRLITEDMLRDEMLTEPPSFQWRVTIRGGLKLGVIPDRVFALEYYHQNGGINRAYFFLEADRGTMPVTRQHLSQTSMYRKFLAYEATWSQSIHQKKFGFNRFRVLTVTSSTSRVKSLVEACSTLPRGHGLFLFSDFASLERSPSMLTHSWQTASPNVQATLLD